MSAAIESQVKGSVLGGVLLLAGCCVGAGMLALPVITGIGGFFPSMTMFLLSWLFMTVTAFLLLEANLAIGHHLSLISIAERTLGKMGKIFVWVLFLFLFYSLSIAYISASGSILQSVVMDILGVDIPIWIGSLFFTGIFGVVVYVGTRPVDYMNRLLMIGLIATYFILVFLGSFHIQSGFWLEKCWKCALIAIPVQIISFGFHNMIPSLAMYLQGDVKRLRLTVLIGSVIPLVVYLIWEAVMLGIIPAQGRAGLLEALDKGQAATQVLREVIGRSWISLVAQLFALFAIITSFLAISLSLVDFLADGLKISKVGMGRLILVLLTLLPPFVFALAYPGIFIRALNYAGGFSAVILFGVMPALMVWVIRYKQNIVSARLMPFGRVLLVAVLIVALSIFFLQMAQEMGLSLISRENSEALS